MSTPVLAHVLTLTTFAVHKPPPGFVPPPPEQWGTVAGLVALCGSPLLGTAGYGELEVLRMGEAMGECRLVYCAMCWPMGVVVA